MYLLLILIILFIIVELVVIIRLAFSLFIMIQGAFYCPTSKDRIKSVLKLAKPEPGNKVVDLGSGDGRLLIALAKKGVRLTGIEIDPFLVWYSKRKIKKAGLDNQIKIYLRSLWKEDLSKYDIILVYGIDYIMKKLEKKLKKEIKKDTKIISVGFQFPNLKPLKKLNNIYLYKK